MNPKRRGLGTLVLAGLALGFHFWISRALLVALEDENRRLVRLLISTDVSSLVLGLIAGPVALFVLHLC